MGTASVRHRRTMTLLTALGPRILAAAGSMALKPSPDDVVLSICRNSTLGSANESHNAVTLLHLLELLQNIDGSPHVAATGANLVYTWKVIGWYPRVRWLARSADGFPWRIAVSDGTGPALHRARRHWRVHYDYSPDLHLDESDFVFPYGVSPALIHAGEWSRKDSFRGFRRSIPLLFAGACSGRTYDRKNLITARYGKMTRAEVVATLRASDRFHEVLGADGLSDLHRVGRPILVDAARARIPTSRWLPTIAATDFLVCAPGMAMPMSHNIIEALGVGTIPLTNYPEWFFPALENGVNCLVFRDTDDLIERVDEILRMPEERIESMRAACRAYYDRHLDPRAVIARLEACPLDELRLHVLDETYEHLPPGQTARRG